MILDHPDLVPVFGAVQFVPTPDTYGRLDGVARSFQSLLGAELIGRLQGGGFAVRVVQKRQFFSIEANRIGGQSLTLDRWQSDLALIIDAFEQAVDVLRVTSLKRIGFKSLA